MMNLKIAKPTETRPASRQPVAFSDTCAQQKTVRAARCSTMEYPLLAEFPLLVLCLIVLFNVCVVLCFNCVVLCFSMFNCVVLCFNCVVIRFNFVVIRFNCVVLCLIVLFYV